ncbi:MAG: hypothetical protein GY793_02320 [Proteobacteria bacterium]|nr:hypothetical protein [Pseudomonadota bacterium]
MYKYSATYEDEFGKEECIFLSDGSELSVLLRGITFSGPCFESLSGPYCDEKFNLFKYPDNEGELTNCRFQVEIPVQAVTGSEEKTINLRVDVKTGETDDYGLKISTCMQDQVFKTRRFGWFEDALVDIQTDMKEKISNSFRFKLCLSCSYSSFHPVGNSMFGGLFCFKNNKEKFKTVGDKGELMDLFDLSRKEGSLINIQETFLCEEYECLNQSYCYKTL